MASANANPSDNNQSHQHIADPDSTFKGAHKLQPSDFSDGHYSEANSLEYLNDIDLWRVHLNAGQTLTVSTDNGQDYNPDTVLALFDGQGQVFFVDDDSGGFFQSFIQYTADHAGNYFIGVSSYANFPTGFPAGGGDFAHGGPEYSQFGFSTGDYILNLDIA